MIIVVRGSNQVFLHVLLEYCVPSLLQRPVQKTKEKVEADKTLKNRKKSLICFARQTFTLRYNNGNGGWNILINPGNYFCLFASMVCVWCRIGVAIGVWHHVWQINDKIWLGNHITGICLNKIVPIHVIRKMK